MKRSTTTLLDKFAHLFRKSGRDEAASVHSTRPESPTETSESLRQLFRRKRHNDAMRVYELSKLRAIIRDGRGIRPRDLIATAAVTTQPRNSGLGSLERTSILNKIDGAEAHLEMWWGSNSGHSALPQKTDVPSPVAPGPTPDEDGDLELDFTGMQDLTEESCTSLYAASGPVPFSDDGRALTAVENGLRDAALLYAEGEFAAAESTLSSLLTDTSLDQDDRELVTFSLFDVYRCSGQQERFEALALDYAKRFGRSPAEWFSIVEKVRLSAPADLCSDTASDPGQQTFWKCPHILDAQALADCSAHYSKNSPVFAVNWLPLQHIDTSVAQALAAQLTLWSSTPLELHWVGVESLEAAIQMCRISSDATENKPWWLIQMDMLCLLQQPQAFEDLALEYCVEFEVSPPNWRTVACKLANAEKVPEAVGSVVSQPLVSQEAGAMHESTYAVHELSGNIIGDNPAALLELHKAAHRQNQLTVSCAHLGRVDINAAGRLFYWVQEQRVAGCSVQFILLPRLVLVYFFMLGMDKLASLSTGSH